MSVNNGLSVKEIEKIIREVDDKYDTPNFSYICQEEIYTSDSRHSDYLNELKEKLGGEIKLLESFRDQGSGDYDGYTWRLELNGRYFEVYGNYSSWEGYDCDDWCDLHEVKKVSKTVEVFEPI